jgi:hypothetical protein
MANIVYNDDDIDDLIRLVKNVRDESLTSTPTVRRNYSYNNNYGNSQSNSKQDVSSQCDANGFTIKSTSKYYNKNYLHKIPLQHNSRWEEDVSDIDEFFNCGSRRSVNWFDEDEVMPNFW